MARTLRATPSCAGDLTLFQKFLMDEVEVSWSKAQADRTSMLSSVQEYQALHDGPDNILALKEMHTNVLCKIGKGNVDAEQMVASMFAAHEHDILGVMKLPPAIFSYADKSMWRGTPSNGTVRKLARSIISTGFRQDSIIASRTLDLMVPGRPEVSFHLLLGDGSSRAVAACLVWKLLCKFADKIPAGVPEVEHLVLSLLQLSVSFERHGAGTPKEALLAQASRQNQAAAVLPVHTLAWVGMVRDYTGLPIGNHPLSNAQLVRTIDEMVSAYNAHPEIEAYDTDIVPSRKKRRTGTRKNIVQDEDRDIGLKIGRRRLMAMKAFLGGATDVVLQNLNTHLCIVGDYKTSVVSDDLLQLKFLYVGSKLSKEQLPTESEIATRDAVAEATMKLIPADSAKMEVRYDFPLSADDFQLMMGKLIRVYESDIEGLDSHESKVKCRPNEEGYLACRKIVQLWSHAIEPVARQELSKEDFDMFQRLILTTDTLDRDIVSIIDRVPKYFHMGLMPSVAGADDVEEVSSTSRLSVAHQKAESAIYEVFEAELLEDWKLISLAAHGQNALKDLVAWLENRHRRQQSLLGVKLVETHCKIFFPMCEVPSWDKVSNQISLLTKSWEKGSGDTRSAMFMDFNVPGARDVLRLQGMVHCAASVAQSLGPHNSILVAWMPNVSKDGGLTTAFDDEIMIASALSKAGFKKQDRIVMMLDMPPSQQKMVSQMDWFVAGRLCYFENDTISSKDNFWLNNSELARTHVVKQSGTLPEPSALVDSTSLAPDEDLNVGGRYLEVSEKCAQRGVEVSLIQLRALFEKTMRQQSTSKWLQRADKTIIVDFQPHVGDRALASYELIRESGGAYGQLHHILVAVGKGVQYKGASYASARVQCIAAAEWLTEKLPLTGPDGLVVRPVRNALPPTPAELKLCPGAAEAIHGVHKLQFRTCSVVGNKIKIRADKLSTLTMLSPEAISKVDILRQKHTDIYESAFIGVGASEPDAEGEDTEKMLSDHRPVVEEEVVDPRDPLVMFESVGALKSNAKIAVECKSAAKGVIMFRDDDKKTVYLMATKDDVTIKAGEMVGGIGGGHITDRDDVVEKAVPWILPKGDKTWVQLARDKDVADEDGGKSKYWSGSLYACLRDIESKCTQPIKLTSFGEVVPVSEGGQSKYIFKCPETAENHRSMDYVLSSGKAGSKIGAQNFFATLISRDTDLGAGVLRTTWRLNFDVVAHTLKPTKVHVTASERIVLPKGQPVKVTWPSV